MFRALAPADGLPACTVVTGLSEVPSLGPDDALVASFPRSHPDWTVEGPRLREAAVDGRIFVIVPPDQVAATRTMLPADAVVLPEDCALDLLRGALRLSAHGYRIVDDARAADSAAVRTSALRVEMAEILSRRENAIACRLRDGASNKEIANMLGISDATVKVHLRMIFRKIGVKNRTQAAIWARENLCFDTLFDARVTTQGTAREM